MSLHFITSSVEPSWWATFSLFEVEVWIFDIAYFGFGGILLLNNELLAGITCNLRGLAPITHSLLIISSLMFMKDIPLFVDAIISKFKDDGERAFRFLLLEFVFGTSPLRSSDFG